jgi:hypothetical protein
MSRRALAGPRHARNAVALGWLLLAGLLSSCGFGESPAAPASQPAAQSTRLAAEAPHPLGNGLTGGSFGEAGVAGAPLPTAPSTAGPEPARSPAAGGAGSGQPATSGSAGIQSMPLPSAAQDVRWRLMYAGPDGKIWTVGREGKDARVLVDSPTADEPPGRVTNLSLSPDGSRLLYTVAGGAPNPRNYMIDLNSAQLSKQKYNGAWAPDSRHVIAASGAQLVVSDVTTGAEEVIGEGSNANWTDDGRIIAVRGGNIWLLPYPTGEGAPRQLTEWPASGDQAWTIWGPLQYHYSNRILFAGAPRGSLDAAGNGIGLHSLDIATRKLVDLASPGGNQVRFLTLSPSGTQLAVAGQTARNSCVSFGWVDVLRADGSGRLVSAGLPQADDNFTYIRGVTWSPDQWVAYSALQRSCAGGALSDKPPEKIYLLNPAQPNAPQYLVDGAFPVWVSPRGLGMLDSGLVAAH